MTHDDITRIATLAFDTPDTVPAFSGGFFTVTPDELQRFAALVAAAEREQCAKACDDAALGFGEKTDWSRGYAQGVRDAADGIRARGQTDIKP